MRTTSDSDRTLFRRPAKYSQRSHVKQVDFRPHIQLRLSLGSRPALLTSQTGSYSTPASTIVRPLRQARNLQRLVPVLRSKSFGPIGNVIDGFSRSDV